MPLPVMKSPCPEDGETERETMKVMLRDLERKYPGLRHRIFGALCKGGIDGFKLTDRLPLVKDEEEDA